MQDKLEVCIKDWAELADEYKELESRHKEYRETLDKCLTLQKKCVSGVTHQKYRLEDIKMLISEVETRNDVTKEEMGEVGDLNKDLLRRTAQLGQMQVVLPRQSGRYLRGILGNVDFSILDKDKKYQYKEQYEQFKLIVNLIGGIIAIVNYFLNYRVIDLIIMFLIFWYYCTITIRESILIINGSRIKGWWRAHHFVSCVVGGVLLVWQDGPAYRAFRDQFMMFNVYVAFLQYLQYVYQKGCLYRLRSLGERQDMDITINGFHSWMWKGLGFLLPFLYLGYMMELYNAYTLYQLMYTYDATWQIPALSILFLVLGVGNITTTSMTILVKLRDSQNKILLKYRFTRLDKYFWSHRRRRDSVRQANPKFVEKVHSILERSSSTLGRLSVTRDSVSSTQIEDVDEAGYQSSDEPDSFEEMVEDREEETKKEL
eukprot:GFUD01001454.1.p1 GENE.GFUD01001454.1~~GFUD01001454.1.p1  ORF type:complete len:429 (+),score=133.49 GFUD01001454.1:926-2212(+)